MIAALALLLVAPALFVCGRVDHELKEDDRG